MHFLLLVTICYLTCKMLSSRHDLGIEQMSAIFTGMSGGLLHCHMYHYSHVSDLFFTVIVLPWVDWIQTLCSCYSGGLENVFVPVYNLNFHDTFNSCMFLYSEIYIAPWNFHNDSWINLRSESGLFWLGCQIFPTVKAGNGNSSSFFKANSQAQWK